MDPNVAAVVIEVIKLIAVIITPIIVAVLTHFQNKKIDGVNNKVDVVDKKLDDNFKQANGHFTALLETTAKLSKEEGKKEEKETPTK